MTELPIFFLSHSGASADTFDAITGTNLLSTFHQDLATRVIDGLQLGRGVKPEEAGYLDWETHKAGETWNDRIQEGLSRCACFVAVLTGSYFDKKRYTVGEFGFFRDRLHEAGRPAGSPPAIIPVLWGDPETQGMIDGLAQEGWSSVHTTIGIPNGPYNAVGLQSLLRRKDYLAYEEAMQAIARAVIRAADSQWRLPAYVSPLEDWFDKGVDTKAARSNATIGPPPKSFVAPVEEGVPHRICLINHSNIKPTLEKILGPEAPLRVGMIVVDRFDHMGGHIVTCRIAYEAKEITSKTINERPICLKNARYSKRTLLSKLADGFDFDYREHDDEELLEEVLQHLDASSAENQVQFVQIDWWDDFDFEPKTVDWFVETFWSRLVKKIEARQSPPAGLLILVRCDLTLIPKCGKFKDATDGSVPNAHHLLLRDYDIQEIECWLRNVAKLPEPKLQKETLKLHDLTRGNPKEFAHRSRNYFQ